MANDPLIPEEVPTLPIEGTDEDPMVFQPEPILVEGTDENPMVLEQDFVGQQPVDEGAEYAKQDYENWLASESVDPEEPSSPTEWSEFVEEPQVALPPADPAAFDLEKEEAILSEAIGGDPWGPDEDLEDREFERLATLTPEERAVEFDKRDAARADEIRRLISEEQAEGTRRAVENQQLFRDAEAQWQTERDEVYRELRRFREEGKVDPDAWMESRSLGQKIAAYASAILGGWLSPLQGGRNSGLELITSAISEHVEAQKANLANWRGSLNEQMGMVADLHSRNMDAYRAGETARLAMLDGFEQRVMMDAARYDPVGTAAQRRVELLTGIQAEKQKASFEMEKELHKRAMDIAKYRLDEREAAAIDRHRRKQEALQGWSIGEGIKDREATMLRAGFRKTKDGWQFDPSLVAEQAGPPSARERRIEQEIGQFELGRQVIVKDPKNTEREWNLGVARGGEVEAREARDHAIAWITYRQGMGELADLIQQGKSGIYKGWGSSRFENEFNSRAKVIREDLANQLAKLRDPTSVNRPSEVEQALSVIPDFDGWTTSKNPMSRYAELVNNADTRFRSYLAQKTTDFRPETDPTLYYQGRDLILLGKDPSAANRSELLLDATTPIDPLVRQDRDLLDISISGRRNRINALGDQDGITQGEYNTIINSLREELEVGPDNGGLLPTEYSKLKSTLDENFERGSRGGARDMQGAVKSFRKASGLEKVGKEVDRVFFGVEDEE